MVEVKCCIYRVGAGEKTEMEAEGRKKMAILYSWGEVTTVMGPVSTSPATPFTVTALSGLGSVAKIQLFKLKLYGASQGLAGFLSNCPEFRLTGPSSSRMEGGWCEMVPEISTHRGCLLKDFTGNSQLLASWRGCLWSLVALPQIWWTPAVDAHPAPRWPPHCHIWLSRGRQRTG